MDHIERKPSRRPPGVGPEPPPPEPHPFSAASSCYSRLSPWCCWSEQACFIQSLNKLRNIDLKLNPTNRYIVHFNPQAADYSPAQVEALYRIIGDRFHAIPGVHKVGISSYTPMEANDMGDAVQIQGQPFLNDGASWLRGNAEYFDSVGTHVLMGRGFTTQDTSTSPAVAVVNQAFVKRFFKPGENPIGRRFGSPGTQSSGDFEIVGVVEDTAYNSATRKNHHMYFYR